jgi:hypothetical protein
MGLLSSPFEERRAIAALRARADRVIPTDLPPQPIPLRVYCYADLDAYDFETESFPIHDHGCDEVIHSLPRNGAMGVKPPGTMPMRIAMSPTEAEAYFRSELRGNSRVTVSYEIDLVVGTAESDTGTRRTTVLSERRNFLLHARDSLTTALLRIDEPK